MITMESLPSVSPSIAISGSHVSNIIRHQRSRGVVGATTTITSYQIKLTTTPSLLLAEDCYGRRGRGRGRGRRRCRETRCGAVSERGGDEDDGRRDEELERALQMESSIPGNCDEFVKRVSSRAYDMRRHLHQTFDSSSYDVLEANPWREGSKPVYVLTHGENQLCTMKTRRNRSEVERELGLLFSKQGNWRSEFENKKKQSRSGTKFRMLVEDVREGVLVFEDEHDAARYCDLLQGGGGQGCEGVAEIEASSVFDICRMMRALAVLFRRGMTPPLPKSLELNLKAKKRSLEDQEDLI